MVHPLKPYTDGIGGKSLATWRLDAKNVLIGGQVSYSVSQMLLPKSFAQASSAFSSSILSGTFIFIPFAESGVKPSPSNGITFISGFT